MVDTVTDTLSYLLQCDNLWKAGIDSLVLTVNTRSKTVWSSGSINGSLFLGECQDLSQKFLKFCNGK